MKTTQGCCIKQILEIEPGTANHLLSWKPFFVLLLSLLISVLYKNDFGKYILFLLISLINFLQKINFNITKCQA